MKASRQERLSGFEPKPLRSALKPQTEAVTEEVRSLLRFKAGFEDCRVKSGYSMKAMASDMGYGDAQSRLTDAISETKGQQVSLWRCARLDRKFWQSFVEFLIEFYDLTIASDPQTVAYAEIGRRVVEVLALSDATRRRA
jgi:hypothetical protein